VSVTSLICLTDHCGVCSEVPEQEPQKETDDEPQAEICEEPHQEQTCDEQDQHQGRRCQVMHYGGMLLLELEGDIFSSLDSLVHCVGEDLKMTKGIAVQFKHRFNGQRSLEQQKKRVGQVAYLKTEDRYIFHLITKQRSCYDLPSICSLRTCLLELKQLCIELGVHRLSMPKIGSGMDRLDWLQVKGAIKDAFSDTNMVIQVFCMNAWEAKRRTKQCQDSLNSQTRAKSKAWHQSVNRFSDQQDENIGGLTSKSKFSERNNCMRSQWEGEKGRNSSRLRVPDDVPRIGDASLVSNEHKKTEWFEPEVCQDLIQLQPIDLMHAAEIPAADRKKHPRITYPEEEDQPSAPLFKNKLFQMAQSEIYTQGEKKAPTVKTGGSFVRKAFSAAPDDACRSNRRF
jgi:O-acetyl-ADP-ribose deacetylase (regulator of RNase III)